jgi:hypothetical protein
MASGRALRKHVPFAAINGSTWEIRLLPGVLISHSANPAVTKHGTIARAVRNIARIASMVGSIIAAV